MKKFKKMRILSIILLSIGQSLFNLALADDNSTAAKDKRVADLKQKIESIQYGAKRPKAIVYVFTDMNCSYCRKLHHEFPKLEEQGIQVRVLAMPRQGLDSPGFKEWVSIWCSKDPNDTLDRAMEGEEIAPQTCKNPIKMHYNLGRKWGVIGTPSVLFADGTLKAGYFPAEKLAKEAIKRSEGMEKVEDKKAEDKKPEEKSDNKAGSDKADKSDKSDKTKVKPEEKAKDAKTDAKVTDTTAIKKNDAAQKAIDKAGDKASDNKLKDTLPSKVTEGYR